MTNPTTNAMTDALDAMRTEQVTRERALRYATLIDNYRSVFEEMGRLAGEHNDQRQGVHVLQSIMTLTLSVPIDLATSGRSLDGVTRLPGGHNVQQLLRDAATSGLESLSHRDAKRLASLDRARIQYGRLRRALEEEFPDEFAALVQTTTVTPKEA
jgi:hypothetical protein